MTWLAQVRAIWLKDLQIHWQGRARVLALGAYGVVLLLLFSFAVGPDIQTLRAHTAAYLWLTLLCCSTLLLSQSFQVEEECGALEASLLLPVQASALYYGKALCNLLTLLGLGVLILTLALGIFDASPREDGWLLLLILFLGCSSLCAPGTLYGALTARVPSQQLLLPVLLFPLLVPSLLAAVKATDLVFEGDPMGQLESWGGLLLSFNIVYWPLCGVLFERVVEE